MVGRISPSKKIHFCKIQFSKIKFYPEPHPPPQINSNSQYFSTTTPTTYHQILTIIFLKMASFLGQLTHLQKLKEHAEQYGIDHAVVSVVYQKHYQVATQARLYSENAKRFYAGYLVWNELCKKPRQYLEFRVLIEMQSPPLTPTRCPIPCFLPE
jgi:hypothetical protein